MSVTGPRLRYRTPDDVRAIPNDQWERWICARAIPYLEFAAEKRCQQTMRSCASLGGKRVLRWLR